MPNITHGMPMDKYQSIKAVSAGMVHLFDSECPFKAFRSSPWNSEREQENNKAFTIGTGAHLAVLEPHDLAERTVLHSFDGYRTKESRSIRDDAWAAGMTPLKPAEWQTILDIRAAVEASEAWPLFQNGASEVTMTWEWAVSASLLWPPLQCKLRADYVPDDGSYLVDLKTCDSAAPDAVQRAIYNFGHHVRASWYLAGVEAATGKRPDKYLFVMVEKNPVGCVTVYELDGRALSRGDQIIAATLPKIAGCIETGVWPGYPGGTIGLPQWSEFRYADREEAGDFR